MVKDKVKCDGGKTEKLLESNRRRSKRERLHLIEEKAKVWITVRLKFGFG